MVTSIHGGRKGRLYLKAHWKKSGIDRKALAGRLHVTEQHVSRLVSAADDDGKIEYRRLLQFADAFGVDVRELMLPPRPKNAPAPPSVDQMIESEDDEFKLEAINVISLMMRRRA